MPKLWESPDYEGLFCTDHRNEISSGDAMWMDVPDQHHLILSEAKAQPLTCLLCAP